MADYVIATGKTVKAWSACPSNDYGILDTLCPTRATIESMGLSVRNDVRTWANNATVASYDIYRLYTTCTCNACYEGHDGPCSTNKQTCPTTCHAQTVQPCSCNSGDYSCTLNGCTAVGCYGNTSCTCNTTCGGDCVNTTTTTTSCPYTPCYTCTNTTTTTTTTTTSCPYTPCYTCTNTTTTTTTTTSCSDTAPSGTAVTYYSWDGTLLKTEYLNTGDYYSPPSAPTRTGYNFVGWYTDGTTNSVHLSAPADFGPGAPTSWTATYEENYIDKYKWSWSSGTSAQITQNVGGVSVTWSGTYNQASKEHDKQTCNDKPATDYIEFTGMSGISQNPATLPDGYSCTPTWTNNQNRLLTWSDATCGDAIVDGVKWWYGTGTCAGPEIDPQVVQHTTTTTTAPSGKTITGSYSATAAPYGGNYVDSVTVSAEIRTDGTVNDSSHGGYTSANGNQGAITASGYFSVSNATYVTITATAQVYYVSNLSGSSHSKTATFYGGGSIIMNRGTQGDWADTVNGN